MFNADLFAEKYRLALQTALESKPQSGLCGFELEWNLLDSQFRPLRTVGSGPSQDSFVDYLRAKCLSPWIKEYSQLEVFHWMIEWATRPYFHPRGAVYEGRLMEAAMLNALDKAGKQFGEELSAWYGNLLFLTSVGHDSIPGSWHLAKRRYLERCVDLYGDTLATAGTHTNLSLPDPLLAWDFMHLPANERGDTHLDEYKSEFYITATRLLRAFAALFIATSASTPLQAQVRNGRPVVALTEIDSVRNLTFPNPPALDLPDLYRSYNDYLQISYDLVRRGVRFGNNNWTPVRARSFAEPVERLISVTSDQLHDMYARGLYVIGQASAVDEMAQQIEIQNLMARINLPMARVEVRTDDGGHPLEIEIANLTLKHLLLIRFYADPDFGRSFRYDREDITRARRNEEHAARNGLRSEIENPLTGKPVGMREFLNWTLNEVQPLGKALGVWEDLAPLVEMAQGGLNTSERLRLRLRLEIGQTDEVPVPILRALAGERRDRVRQDVETIAGIYPALDGEAAKVGEFLQRARDDVRLDPQAPIRFRPRPEGLIELAFPDKTSEIVALAQQLIQIPSITACPDERLDEVRRAATFIFDYLRNYGVGVRYYNQSKYPAILAGFPENMQAPVMLSGHFDVVTPEPDDSQFVPRAEGDYLWGRGAADMKTVVATYLVWLKDSLRHGPPYPPINLLLVGNEENGEIEPMGTPHVLRLLAEEEKDPTGKEYAPRILIAGERTGEKGDELWGEICTQNRGVMRFQLVARGQRGHSGTASPSGPVVSDLTERLLLARASITGMFGRHLTLSSPDGWQSQARFPFIQIGTQGVYNVTADVGYLGVEVRPIPQDDLFALLADLRGYCESQGLEFLPEAMENGVICDPNQSYLQGLIKAVRKVSGNEPAIGRKLPGTSARFAPGGQGVVWGQSGLGPHARNERHFIPSILPYYQSLQEFGKILNTSQSVDKNQAG
jgi:acetylornithine deacetylase/succinyl-diaminopimelate desuccinylase-like protein/gamma-glutamyl:cysteine ligase YbdK (ATP-grasp superfamily)